MSSQDKYQEIAEQYDAMSSPNSLREAFFKNHFRRNKVRRVLDCACGTGNDLLLFQQLGYYACGSDLSEAMLAVAQRKMRENKVEIPLRQADFHLLEQHYRSKFDAVVCLSNAINEFDVNVVKALSSMHSILNPGGIIVFDQGQTDFSMKDPPLYTPIVNNEKLSRLFVMDYANSVMTVQIFDFIHAAKENKYDFHRSEFKIRIRLLADWQAIMNDIDMQAEYYGDWDSTEYDIANSKRLIVIAKKNEKDLSSKKNMGKTHRAFWDIGSIYWPSRDLFGPDAGGTGRPPRKKPPDAGWLVCHA